MFHDLHQGVEAGGSLNQEFVALKIIVLSLTQQNIKMQPMCRVEDLTEKNPRDV